MLIYSLGVANCQFIYVPNNAGTSLCNLLIFSNKLVGVLPNSHRKPHIYRHSHGWRGERDRTLADRRVEMHPQIVGEKKPVA